MNHYYFSTTNIFINYIITHTLILTTTHYIRLHSHYKWIQSIAIKEKSQNINNSQIQQALNQLIKITMIIMDYGIYLKQAIKIDHKSNKLKSRYCRSTKIPSMIPLPYIVTHISIDVNIHCTINNIVSECNYECNFNKTLCYDLENDIKLQGFNRNVNDQDYLSPIISINTQRDNNHHRIVVNKDNTISIALQMRGESANIKILKYQKKRGHKVSKLHKKKRPKPLFTATITWETQGSKMGNKGCINNHHPLQQPPPSSKRQKLENGNIQQTQKSPQQHQLDLLKQKQEAQKENHKSIANGTTNTTSPISSNPSPYTTPGGPTNTNQLPDDDKTAQKTTNASTTSNTNNTTTNDGG